jgi:thioredoxin-like negative regulator of GroEL
MKPVVDRLNAEYQGVVEFRIMDVDTSEGGQLADSFGITAVPTFVFIDTSGAEAERVVGGLSEERFRKLLDELD